MDRRRAKDARADSSHYLTRLFSVTFSEEDVSLFRDRQVAGGDIARLAAVSAGSENLSRGREQERQGETRSRLKRASPRLFSRKVEANI